MNTDFAVGTPGSLLQSPADMLLLGGIVSSHSSGLEGLIASHSLPWLWEPLLGLPPAVPAPAQPSTAVAGHLSRQLSTHLPLLVPTRHTFP